MDPKDDPAKPSPKVTDVVSAVLFVQFEDGTTWGDLGTGKKVDRPWKLAFLKHLVETYYESGEDAFNATLNDAKLQSLEKHIALYLTADAQYRATQQLSWSRSNWLPRKDGTRPAISRRF